MPRSDVLAIEPRAWHDLLREHARGGVREACGVLLGDPAGRPALVRTIATVRNASPAPRARYEIAPVDLLDWLRRDTGDPVLGFYHSHPAGPPTPSNRDLERALPGWWYVIVGVQRDGSPGIGAWRDGGARRVVMVKEVPGA